MKKFSTEYEEARYYKELFEQHKAIGGRIYTKKKDQFVELEENEEFKQCWANTPPRKKFPKRWFTSSEHLLSVYNNRIIYVPKNPREQGREFYMYKYYDEKKGKKVNKNIEVHNLVWLTWEVEAFGKAESLFEERGDHAFGVASRTEDVAQGHHKDGDKFNNDPSNGKFITYKVHELVENAPAYNTDPEVTYEFMKEFGQVLSKETDRACIMFTGERGESVEKMQPTGVKDIQYLEIDEPIKLKVKIDLIKEAVQCFLDQHGVEKFKKKTRYVYIDTDELDVLDRFYKVYLQTNQICYEKMKDFNEIGKMSMIYIKPQIQNGVTT